MAFFGPADIAHDSTLTIDGAEDWLFGILQSSMFTAWVKGTSGRLKSDVRVSPDLSYNAFPFPVLTSKGRARIEDGVALVLEARAMFPDSTLAQMYSPTGMPPTLLKAHEKLDAAVDSLYRVRRALVTDEDRLTVLFDRYRELVSPLVAV